MVPNDLTQQKKFLPKPTGEDGLSSPVGVSNKPSEKLPLERFRLVPYRAYSHSNTISFHLSESIFGGIVAFLHFATHLGNRKQERISLHFSVFLLKIFNFPNTLVRCWHTKTEVIITPRWSRL